MNTKTYSIILLSAAAAISLVLFSFKTGKGNYGPVKSETRTVTDFSGIKAGSVFQIDYTPSSTASVVIEAPEQVLPKIKTSVSNGVLSFSLTGELNNLEENIKVHINGTTLKSVNMSGASSFKSNSQISTDNFELDACGASRIDIDLKTKKTEIDASGAVSIELKGSTTDLELELSGASSLKSGSFEAENCKFDLSGASSGTVRASKSVSGEASGASSIHYKGKPASKNVSTSGASSVHED